MKRPDPKLDPEGWRRYWDAQIEAAQDETHALVGNTTYPRIAYGDDFPDAVRPTCRDCGVAFGQLHVMGSLVELCPRCRDRQACGCVCADGGELPRSGEWVH